MKRLLEKLLAELSDLGLEVISFLLTVLGLAIAVWLLKTLYWLGL